MALHFDGVDDYAQSSAVLSTVSGKARLAISFWINTTFSADTDMLLELSAIAPSNAGAFMILGNEGGSNLFWFDLFGNVGRHVRTVDTAPTDSTWHHILTNFNFAGANTNAATAEIENVVIDGVSNILNAGLTIGAGLDANNTGTFGSYVLNVMSRNGTTFFSDGDMSQLTIWAPSTPIAGADATALAAGDQASTIRNSEILYHWPMASNGIASIGGVNLTVVGATAAADPPSLDPDPNAIVAAPLATSTMAAPVPVVTATANVSVAAVPATFSFLAPPPNPTGSSATNVTVNAVTATSTSLALVPAVTGAISVSVTAVAATFSMDTEEPAVSGEVVVSGGGPGVLTLLARVPTITGSADPNATVSAVTATFSMLARVPTVLGVGSVVVQPPTVNFTFTTPVPTVTATGGGNVTVSAPRALLAFSANAPTLDGVTINPTVDAPVGTITFEAHVPHVIAILPLPPAARLLYVPGPVVISGMDCDPVRRQDPQDFLDYVIDWSKFLSSDDEIVASTWEVTTGITASNDLIYDDYLVGVWLSGGVHGKGYWVTNHVTTSMGREKDYSFRLVVVNA